MGEARRPACAPPPARERDSVYAYAVELDEWLRARANALTETPTTSGTARSHRRLTWWLAILCLSAAIALVSILVRWSGSKPNTTTQQIRFSVAPPVNASFGTASLSPDARHLAFTASTADGRSALWVRPLSAVTAAPIPGTEGATFPFWSPDGAMIGFFAQGKLKTVPLAGGDAHVVCDAPDGRGGSWNRGGTILFAPSRDTALFRVSAAGGIAEPDHS